MFIAFTKKLYVQKHTTNMFPIQAKFIFLASKFICFNNICNMTDLKAYASSLLECSNFCAKRN